MKVSFVSTANDKGFSISAEKSGLFSRDVVPVENWEHFSDDAEMAGRFLTSLLEIGSVRIQGQSIFVPYEETISWPQGVSAILGLPPLCKLSLKLTFDGRIEGAGSRIRIQWNDEMLRSVNPKRTGTVLKWGKSVGRLGEGIFRLIEAVDSFNRSIEEDVQSRISKWADVQASLSKATGNQVSSDGYLGTLTIYQAGSFSLDIRETKTGPDFVPVLMARSKIASIEDDAPISDLGSGSENDPSSSGELADELVDGLLTPELQKKFISEHFNRGGKASSSYALDKNVFVVLDPSLQQALDVVRAKRAAPTDERRAFLKNPRAYVSEAPGSEDEQERSSIFVETRQYSERVVGLGIWETPSLPWLTKRRTQWLPENFEIVVEGKKIALGGEKLEEIKKAISAAKSEGSKTVSINSQIFSIVELERAISKVDGSAPTEIHTEGDRAPQDIPSEERETEVLIVKTNLEDLEYELRGRKRNSKVSVGFPAESMASNAPKPHQIDGIIWLQQAWMAGWPGVLLADDMGLGKTYQSLAFLAWIGLQAGQKARAGQTFPGGPILIVAPTALLKNWILEAELHLAPYELGHRVDAFGSNLSKLKKAKTPDWTPEDALDLEVLRTSDWILTTYETLADYHRSFARIAYSVVIFDEMQKVKSPGTINTQAAAAINADFVVGLTGTPIENRIEDLWCIMDRVAPGYLGDLRSFSTKYRDEKQEDLLELKACLDTPRSGLPQLMLRRMKEKNLEGLPTKTVKTYRGDMPRGQADAYGEIVLAAKSSDKTPSQMLKAIHSFRSISLHPWGGKLDPHDKAAINEWIEASARTRLVISILEQIKESSEKALIFIEDRDVQRTFATAAMFSLGLRSQPQIINGSVPGEGRQGIVDRFQNSKNPFDILILSPKAAGIGLNITAANHVLHLSRWWNPAVEDQCNDRVYRIGQKRAVTVHIPLAVHPTLQESSFDLKLDHLLEQKRALSRNMLKPPVSDGDIGNLFNSTIGREQPGDVSAASGNLGS